MTRVEPGTQAVQAMQVSISVAGQNKVAGNRPAAARPSQQPGSSAATTSILVSADFAQLQKINDQQNEAASQIRSNDRQLQESDQLLGKMKRVLSDIIKYYPPYPAGETERVKYLRSFSSMRQQIEAMTIPPESTWKGRMPGAPLPQSETIQAGNSSSSAVAAIGPGVATTFAIPELPDMVDDVQIGITLNLIDTAQAAIADRRASIAEQASSINQSAGYGAKAEELSRTSPEAWDLTLPTENKAEQKSTEAARDLEQTPGSGITKAEMQPLLQSLAG